MNFLHNFEPSRILLDLGPITIYWYGFFVTLGVVGGILTVLWLSKKYGFNQDKIYNLIFYTLILGFIGDRLMHVFLEIDYYLIYPWDIFKVWQGGLAIHGAIIAGAITVLIYSRRQDLGVSKDWSTRFWLLTDICAVAIVLGQAIGRWGNYFNQELYGLPTDSVIGIPINLVNRVSGYEMYEYFLPTFLFQALVNLLIFAILLMWHLERLRSTRSRKQEAGSRIGYGNIFLAYLVLYGVGRFVVECVRIDPQPIVFGLRYGQWASLGLLLAAFILFFVKKYGFRGDRSVQS